MAPPKILPLPTMDKKVLTVDLDGEGGENDEIVVSQDERGCYPCAPIRPGDYVWPGDKAMCGPGRRPRFDGHDAEPPYNQATWFVQADVQVRLNGGPLLYMPQVRTRNSYDVPGRVGGRCEVAWSLSSVKFKRGVLTILGHAKRKPHPATTMAKEYLRMYDHITWVQHTTKAGETFSQLCERYHVSWQALSDAFTMLPDMDMRDWELLTDDEREEAQQQEQPHRRPSLPNRPLPSGITFWIPTARAPGATLEHLLKPKFRGR